MATQQALTAWDAVAALMPLVGTGGIGAVVIAWLAYRKAALEGRRGDPERAGIGISALLADSSSVEKLVISIDRLALAADKISLLTAESKVDFFGRFEGFVDEIRKLRRAVEDLGTSRQRH